MLDNNDFSIQKALEEMRQSEGWHLLSGELNARFNSAARQLITGTTTDIVEITQLRTTCKVINSIMRFAGDKQFKEERNG